MATLSEIAAILQVNIPPTVGTTEVTGLAMLNDAGPTELSFLGSDAYLKQFESTKAAAILVNKRVKLPPTDKTVIIVDDADLAVAKVLTLFAPPIPRPPTGVDSFARVAPTAQIAPTAAVAPFVTIGDRTRIGNNTIIHSGVVISADVIIGDDCELFPNVVIRERCTLGNRVIIHANSSIGSDGFGYRWDGKQHAKIPQIGTVIIEDDVEIGSNSCVDRAKFSTTRIGRGTKIDNLVQIAHNCILGPNCLMAGQAGLAGSVTLGAGVVVGGQSAIRDHTTVGDAAMIAGSSGVAGDVEPKTVVSGTPAIPHRQTLREQAALRHLPDLRTQVRKLQEEVERLKSA